MPSKSKSQSKFMAAASKNTEFAKKVGVSQKVAREFHGADKKRKLFGMGKPKAK